MRELFSQYFFNLYHAVPQGLYEFLISSFCLGSVVVFAFNGYKKGCRFIEGLLLIEYIILLFCSMVAFRPFSEIAGYELTPFWSYIAIYNGWLELIPENVMNVVVFVPIGILLGALSRSMTWRGSLLIGCGISVFIESLQFILKRGFAETDDIIHNTLGCLIGYGVYSLVRMEYEKLSKRRVTVS